MLLVNAHFSEISSVRVGRERLVIVEFMFALLVTVQNALLGGSCAGV